MEDILIGKQLLSRMIGKKRRFSFYAKQQGFSKIISKQGTNTGYPTVDPVYIYSHNIVSIYLQTVVIFVTN